MHTLSTRTALGACRSFRCVLLLILLHAAVPERAEPSDCHIGVLAPQEGAVYYRSTHSIILSNLDIKFGSGPVSDAIRSDPEGFEVCVSWSANDTTLFASGEGRSSYLGRTFDACRGLLVSSHGSPAFGWERQRQRRRWKENAASPQEEGETETFVALLRSRRHFLDPTVLAATVVKFHAIDDVETKAEDELGKSVSPPVMSSPQALKSQETTAAAAAPSQTAASKHDDVDDRGQNEEGAEATRPSLRPCRAAVCVSGQWRTFALPSIRKKFRDNLLGGLSGEVWRKRGDDADVKNDDDGEGGIGSFNSRNATATGSSIGGGDGGDVGCFLDVFFFAKTSDAVSDRNRFFARTSALPADEASILATVEQEFPEIHSAHQESLKQRGGQGQGGRVKVVHEDSPMPRSSSSSSGYDDDDDDGNGGETWVRRHLEVAWPALSSVRSCFEMVKEAEEHELLLPPEPNKNNNDKDQQQHVMPQRNYYDWVIRTRFDLVYLWPLPTLVLPNPPRWGQQQQQQQQHQRVMEQQPVSQGDGGSNDSSDGVRSNSAYDSRYDSQSVHIPYTSLPISDVFAISPRNLAPAYFEADEECICNQQQQQQQQQQQNNRRRLRRPLSSSDFQRGAGPTEELLLRHLVHHLEEASDDSDNDSSGEMSGELSGDGSGSVRLRLHEFPIAIARPDPDPKCQGLPVMGLPCLLLVEAPGWGHPFKAAAECTTAATFAVASLCDRSMSDQGRGLQLGKEWMGPSEVADIETSMRAFLAHSADLEKEEKGGEERNDTPDEKEEEGEGERDSLVETNSKVKTSSPHVVNVPSRIGLPLFHNITLGADPWVAAENVKMEMAVPRHVKASFLQHPRETLMARKALGCLFAFHLTSSPSSSFSSSFQNLEVMPRTLWECTNQNHGGTLSSPTASLMAVSRYLSEWNSAAWGNIVEFTVSL